MKNIRNFSIIAHVNHGKSTLSGRITQTYDGLSDHEMGAQVLDSMGLGRKRGVTIKAQSVALGYKASDGETCQLNFIDTPGHVDFSYEASRLLAAREGASLVADAGQGVEAQALANCYAAMEMDLEVVPVLNKIDLPAADPGRVAGEVEGIVNIDTTDAVCCPVKTSVSTQSVLECLVRDIPPPGGDPEDPLQALIIGSWFDDYLGVVPLIRTKNGILRKGDGVKVMSTGQTYNVDRLGIFMPEQVDHTELKYGEVGWLVCAIKNIHGAPVDDTLTLARSSAEKALPDSKKAKPQVHAGLLPVSSSDYEALRDALGKLSLNDAPLFYGPESLGTLGFGFRYGFLGLLRMEITQEYLGREYDLDLVTTASTVVYKVEATSGEAIYANSPSKLPVVNNIYELREPIAECRMLLLQAYLGNTTTLYVERRDVRTNMAYHGNRVALMYEILMAEVVLGFLSRLKSTSHGRVSLDYNFKRFQAFDMVRADILVDDERVGVLVSITHHDNSQNRGHELVEKTRDLILCQQFDITTQTAIDTHIIARSTVRQLRKNALVRCYGGNINRKKKLPQKQKEGKKRIKRIGDVELSQKALLTTLHVGKDNRQPLGVGMTNMFALILVIATLMTDALWYADKFSFALKRRERQAATQTTAGDPLDKATLEKAAPKPGWLKAGASVFPVLATVLIVRSFIYGPFQIPSGSVMSTLLIGDFTLVEKFAYGIKGPICQKTLIETDHPKCGDTVVFKCPEDPKLDYIKHAMGLPSDRVAYDPVSKELTI